MSLHRNLTSQTIAGNASFRFAGLEDLDALIALYERFFGEAIYKDHVEWDHCNARNSLELRISADVRPHLVAVVDARIVGFVAWELDHTFTKAPIAIMAAVYVEPEHRTSAIGRTLFKLMRLSARDQGACVLHVPVASGSREAAGTLLNMLVKEGCEGFGYILRISL